MKRTCLTAALLALAGAANAQIPMLNAKCGPYIEVHADQGGPVYINGHEADLKTINDNAYEARYKNATVSLTINPDGSPMLSYTGRNNNNGLCELAGSGHKSKGGGGCPPDVSQADRYKYPACD